MSREAEVQYLVLPDITNPYLLARVRWPDVCQAISVGRPVWQDDLGLFDLPYERSSTPVTLSQAITIAAGWGVRLGSDETAFASDALLIRRMPANWSNLSPAEKRAWSIEFVNPGRRTSRRAVSSDDRVTAGASTMGPPRGRWRRRSARPTPQQVAVDPAEVLVGGRNGSPSAGSDDIIDLRDGSHDRVPYAE